MPRKPSASWLLCPPLSSLHPRHHRRVPPWRCRRRRRRRRPAAARAAPRASRGAALPTWVRSCPRCGSAAAARTGLNSGRASGGGSPPLPLPPPPPSTALQGGCAAAPPRSLGAVSAAVMVWLCRGPAAASEAVASGKTGSGGRRASKSSSSQPRFKRNERLPRYASGHGRRCSARRAGTVAGRHGAQEHGRSPCPPPPSAPSLPWALLVNVMTAPFTATASQLSCTLNIQQPSDQQRCGHGIPSTHIKHPLAPRCAAPPAACWPPRPPCRCAGPPWPAAAAQPLPAAQPRRARAGAAIPPRCRPCRQAACFTGSSELQLCSTRTRQGQPAKHANGNQQHPSPSGPT